MTKNMDFANKKILVVDDEPFILNLLQLVLRKAGFTVLTAENGQRGLELAAKEIPDLILTDLMMPVINGIEFCKKIKSNKKFENTIFIVLTARTDKEDKTKLMNLGADDFLLKPINKEDLIAKISAFMRIQNLQMELKAKNEELASFKKELNEQTGKFNASNKKIQPPLIKKEMQASIGQMAASVACNINDPIEFVKNNLTVHKKYASDIKELLNQYDSITENLSDNLNDELSEMLTDLRTFKDQIDLEFVLSDLDKIIEESIDGINRVQKIIESLGEYTNLDDT